MWDRPWRMKEGFLIGGGLLVVGLLLQATVGPIDWDPKETWAAITWLCYLIYVHFRRAEPARWRAACRILLFSFVCLQICWWGINYLPSAHIDSMHTY